MPAGACDCHIHVYGSREAYPLAPTSPFAPPLATPDDYRKIMRELGTERVVLAFGDANSSALITMPEREDYKYVVMPMRI